MSAFFVTATGTDIGKTFITAGLIRHLRGVGKYPRAFKPVVSGFERANAAASDPGVLLDAMGEAISDENLNRISPWRYAAPLSPDMAAVREGKTLDFDAIVAAARAQTGDPLFVEGVGGVMVPLDARRTVLDLMAALKLPLIVVTGNYLGTLSHTLTALEALRARDLTVAALVVNGGDDPVPLAETVAALARFARGTPIATIPHVSAPHEAAPAFAALASLLGLC